MAKGQGVSSRTVRTVVLILLAITLIVTLILFVIENGALPSPGSANMIFAPTNIVEPYDMDSRAQIYTTKGEKGFFLASRDGVRFITSDGQKTMNSTYNITSPLLVGKGGIIGVAEENGFALHVFNAGGQLYSVSTEHPILHFSVAENGYSVVITKRSTDYDIIVYNNSGITISYSLFAEANVYPMAADVSNDGRILAVSYLDTTGGEIHSKITFAYISKTEAANFAADNGVFAAVNQNPDRLVGLIRFMKGNVLLAVSDKDVACYEADNGAQRRFSLQLGNKLDAVCLTESDWFALAYGARNPNLPGAEPGTCAFYDLNGSTLGEYRAAEPVTQLTAGYNAVLVCSERRFTAVSQSGNALWTHDATYDVSQALFMDNTNKLVLAGGTQAEVLQRVKDTSADTTSEPSATSIASETPASEEPILPEEPTEPETTIEPEEPTEPEPTPEEES